ncbi:MAG: lipopolysaccharide heptosyltransferase II [Candidatus Omnitrophica bacterium]|nr:lipopolysaccharide heptosyltransferase II [Candidatus Omnitrophota bacterium]
MIKRILIVNVNWVGDVLFSTPFIRALRAANPDAHIACLLHPRCREMLESNPRLNEIIIYDEDAAHKGLIGKWRLVKELKKRRFDTAFLLHRSFTKAFITYLAGIKERVGYPTKNRGGVLTRIIEEPSEELHKVEYFLNIARAAGCDIGDSSYEFFVQDEDRKFIKELLAQSNVSDKDIVVVLCPAGNWPPKRWPAENFARLGDELADKFGAKIVLSAAGKDLKLVEEIKSVMASAAVIASGKTGLKQLGALLERADLVVANDTGPMHMAVAVGADTIALFGPTSAGLTGPYGKGRYRVISRNESCEVPCYDVTCTDNACMSAIKVEDVLGEAEAMLRKI